MNKGKNIAPFIDIKILPNGQLVVHEESTLDLVFYDPELREIKRLPRATNSQNPFNQSYKTIKHGTSQNLYGWYAGNEELRIVNLTNGEFMAVNNFFGIPGQRAIPLAITISDRERKAAGLFTLGNNSEVFLGVLTSNNSVSHNPFESLVKQRGSISSTGLNVQCVETTADEILLVFGAGQQIDNSRSIPKLYMTTFEAVPRLLDEIDLSSNGKYLGPIHTVKRFTGKNVFLVGGHKFAMVVEWTGSHLCILNAVDDVHSGKFFLL